MKRISAFAVLVVFLVSLCGCEIVDGLLNRLGLERIEPETHEKYEAEYNEPEEPAAEETEPIPTEPLPTEPMIRYPYPALGAHTPGAVWDESVWQKGTPITPEPGDTMYSYDLSRAAAYPEDAYCSDTELLEKWLYVEGLTYQDLEERGCRQLVLTVAQSNGVDTINTCYQRLEDGSWQAVGWLSRMSGWCGGNGTVHGRIRNSNTSPAGLWSLGLAFGNQPRPNGTKMPWRDIGPNSDWVDDPDSIYFNTWQERGDPNLTGSWNFAEAEHLADYTYSYKYACVIRFNAPPYVVPERGSAIFLHNGAGPTAGCLAVGEADMVDILLWLDPEAAPYILITGQTRD